jgi:hypothetical protein
MTDRHIPSKKVDYVAQMRRWAVDKSDRGPSSVILNGCAVHIEQLQAENRTLLNAAANLHEQLYPSPETGVSRVAQLETALGQWLHDFGSTNELSQRTRILLGIPHPPPVKAAELPNPVDDAEFGTAEWRRDNAHE